MLKQLTFGIALVAAILLAVTLTSCKGDEGPTSPQGGSLVLTQAVVSVNGQVVNGETLPQGHGQGMAERFEAVLEENGARMTGGTVRVQHDSPGGMMMCAGSKPPGCVAGAPRPAASRSPARLEPVARSRPATAGGFRTSASSRRATR